MKLRFARASLALLGVVAMSCAAQAQQASYATPSLLPPSASYAADDPALQTAARSRFRLPVFGTFVQDAAPPVADSMTEGPQYTSTENVLQQDASADWNGDYLGYGGAGCNSRWFGSVSGLIMTRDDENDVWLSYDTINLHSRVITSRDAEQSWDGGFEVRLGRWAESRQWGVEGAYWGLFPNVSEVNALAGYDTWGDLETVLNFDSLDYDDGSGPAPVTSFYNAAERHRLRRSFQYHNVELNLLGTPCCPCAAGCGDGCCGRNKLRFGWAAGVRWFRFDEGLQYASDPVDWVFDGAAEELYYTSDVDNNLIGLQIGGRVDYSWRNRLAFYADAKLGLYNNYITHQQYINCGDQYAFVSLPISPFDGQAYNIYSNKNDVAFLGELNLGVEYLISSCWSARMGYRAVAATGVALATEQIPIDYWADLALAERIDSNGSLILHGAYLGVEYNF